MGMLEIWKNALTDPKKTFASEKKKASISEGVKHLAVPGVIMGFLAGLVVLLLSGTLALIPGLSWIAALGAAAVIILPIVLATFLVVGSLITVGIYHVFAKLLGGKGKYEQLFYLNAIYTAPLALVTLVIQLIPFLGGIAALLLNIYGLYLAVLAIKEAHQLDTVKAIAAIILLWVALAVLVVALVLSLAAGAATR